MNPVEGAKAPQKPPAEMVFLTADQIMSLAEELTNPTTGQGTTTYPERGLHVRFVGFTGLRAGEIVAIRAEALDLLHGRVRVVAFAVAGAGFEPATYH